MLTSIFQNTPVKVFRQLQLFLEKWLDTKFNDPDTTAKWEVTLFWIFIHNWWVIPGRNPLEGYPDFRISSDESDTERIKSYSTDLSSSSTGVAPSTKKQHAMRQQSWHSQTNESAIHAIRKANQISQSIKPERLATLRRQSLEEKLPLPRSAVSSPRQNFITLNYKLSLIIYYNLYKV